MKWTPKMEDKLRKLCFEDKSNADLAVIFNCDVKDIHAARSRLGITIPKVKAAKATDKQPTDPWVPIKAAFDRLDMALLGYQYLSHCCWMQCGKGDKQGRKLRGEHPRQAKLREGQVQVRQRPPFNI